MAEPVLAELSEGVLTLTLNRPEKKNALSDAMYGALADGLEQAETDERVGCVLFTGVDGVFTAGNDLNDFMAQNQNSAASGPRQVTRFLNGLASARAPLIAAVSGLAVGVGATLLLHCDLVYLSESAVLSTPFVDLALVPEAASSLLLPARVGHARAFAMFALAERVGAAEALSWGLANRVLPEAELLGAARAAALAVCAKPRGALRHAKALMKAGYDLPEVMARENVLFASQLRSEEAAAAFAAFAARRRSS